MILPYLLHHANRVSKDPEFYAIKDKILSKYGNIIGIDIQHIPGKKCNSCAGTGQHEKYSNRYPYKVYDYADCYHCWGGWYKMPQWILLNKIKFGKYIFHKPIERKYCVKNPFGLNPKSIDGYIEHSHTDFGKYAMVILFYLYDKTAYKTAKKYLINTIKWRVKYRWIKFKRSLILYPKMSPMHYYSESNELISIEGDDNLPF